MNNLIYTILRQKMEKQANDTFLASLPQNPRTSGGSSRISFPVYSNTISSIETNNRNMLAQEYARKILRQKLEKQANDAYHAALYQNNILSSSGGAPPYIPYEQAKTNKRKRSSLEANAAESSNEIYTPQKKKTKKAHCCPECNHPFMTPSALKIHYDTVHLKKRLFQCYECGKRFSTRVNIQAHIKRVHLNLKPYKCPICDFHCSEKNKLKRHVNAVHLKLKPYKCNQCDYRCTQKVHLRNHINAVHLKLKPFKCDKCNKCFAVKQYLTNHIKRMHS